MGEKELTMELEKEDDDVDDGDEEFEDALEKISLPSDMDLSTSIEETSIALKLFLNNKFAAAKERMEPHSLNSMYPALGYGTILYLQAVMTFDMTDIETAIQTIKKSIGVCNRFRRKTTMMGSFRKTLTKVSYNELSEEEIHAELCYAECLLLRALLTFIQDENLISFVKGGLKVRECYKIYKECNKILKSRTWSDEEHRLHFESGVKMGVGAFNLMISLLPGKIMKLLEFVGFSGNKKLGLSELENGCKMQSSLRGPLCAIVLVAYHTVVTYVLGLGDGDIELADQILKPCLVNYPKGALFLFFAGRIQEVRGNIHEAIYKFEESIDSQSEWRQFHHLCFWELMWCHCFKGDWLLAMKYAEKLCRESRWSKATYTYQKAAFLTMCDDQSEHTKSHIAYLFGEVPNLKQRIAGKSLPFEKFAVAKTLRYREQNNRLTLPALELIYVWNGFNIIGQKMSLLEPMLVYVEDTINELQENKEKYLYFHDDYALALLLKGVCLFHRGQLFQANQCFLEVVSYEKQIQQDFYLIPYALVEMARICLKQDEIEETKSLLEKTKKSYKGYYLESRLHFRIHAIKLQLNTRENKEMSSPCTPTASPLNKSFDMGADVTS